MRDSERCLYLENPKRPYSWTGELDAPPSPPPFRNGSLKVPKGPPAPPCDVTELYIKPDRRRSKATKASFRKGAPSRPFNDLPPTGSFPSHLSKDGGTLGKKDTCPPQEDNPPLQEANCPLQGAPKDDPRPPPGYSPPPPEHALPPNETSPKRKFKFSHLRRKSPPAMTSHVSDFEYFSLSEPPAGLARPVQIFPAASGVRRPANRSDRVLQESEGEKCRDCMTRIPYATLIATILCCVGVGVFCGTMYRGTTLTLLMFDEVFRIKITWDREFRVEPVQLTFMIVGAAMGGLGLMILFLGCLSTGSTRAKVYRTWRGRVGGRVSCAIFMAITYLLSIIWLMIFTVLIIATIFYTLAWFQCQYIPENQCIDYNQFEFMFPSSTTEEDRKVCREERKTFCKDCVNNAEVMFILASVSAFLVIMSLIHYLMCLSSNYAHIKDQEKFIDLQEIQYLQDCETEMSTLPKDRF